MRAAYCVIFDENLGVENVQPVAPRLHKTTVSEQGDDDWRVMRVDIENGPREIVSPEVAFRLVRTALRIFQYLRPA